MQEPGIFGIPEYSYSIPTHIQNPVIFTKLGKPCYVTLEIQNPGIIHNPKIIRTLAYLKRETYLELSKP